LLQEEYQQMESAASSSGRCRVPDPIALAFKERFCLLKHLLVRLRLRHAISEV